MREKMQSIDAFFQRRSKASILSIAVFVVLLLGYLDYITGFEFTFSFFYLIPVAFVTWYIDKRAGCGIAFFSTVSWFFSNYTAGLIYGSEIIRYWNAFIRFALFIMIVLLLGEFKHTLNHERLLARTDYLTGIPNRREFYFQLEREIEYTRRFGRPLTIACMDVDAFKQINDLYGHTEGDAILRAIAQAVLYSIRKTDMVARLGGDEFAVMFPDTNQDRAEVIIARMRNRLAGQMKNMKSQATFSIGVATFDAPPDSVDELIGKADEAMYKVKMAGKNDVVFVNA